MLSSSEFHQFHRESCRIEPKAKWIRKATVKLSSCQEAPFWCEQTVPIGIRDSSGSYHINPEKSYKMKKAMGNLGKGDYFVAMHFVLSNREWITLDFYKL